MKYTKLFLVGFIVLVVFSYALFKYLLYIEHEKEKLKNLNYQSQAVLMQKRVHEMIIAKQKSTVAIALSLANDIHLSKNIQKKQISKEYYAKLINDFKDNTLYQNIWIQVINKEQVSLYRSWSDLKGDNLNGLRKDLTDIQRDKKVIQTIAVGKFGLGIKAILPVLEHEKYVGVVEVISHFNSISKQMKKFNIDSVVILDKNHTKKIKYPFTNIFINDCYVANLDASNTLMQWIKTDGVDKYFHTTYKIDNGYLITSYELKSFNNEKLGHYVMFKRLNNISNMNLDFFMFKGLSVAILIVMILAGIMNLVILYLMRRQKNYFKKIIDSSTNIIIVNHQKNMLDVNKVFFKYFTKYKTKDEFLLKYKCICDLFISEEGYITKEMDGLYWVEYLLKHTKETNKVSIELDGKIYYFIVRASLLFKNKEYASIIFSDVTKEENYKKVLEVLSVTDGLTGLKNRRYFEQKFKDEISRSHRYKHSLSLVMLDIDYFKKVNDEHGHGVGDNVLVEYTKLISSMLREGDVFSRIGGEEFMIILPETSKEDAKNIAEKLCFAVENYKKVLPITMSFGVTQYLSGEDMEYILKRVDDALYEAKETGRNKVIVK